MRPPLSKVLTAIPWLISCCVIVGSTASANDRPQAFTLLTDQIHGQIQKDKQGFVLAQNCTEWFYRERTPRSPRPKVEGVSFDSASDCSSRYPGGLNTAREDFSRTQSLLSFSLTFYEYALVADRNDDQRYSTRELQDMLEVLGLPYQEALTDEANLATLQNIFQQLHGSADLDLLMTGMTKLYEKGYRLTARDRRALDQAIG